jgi:hypothetical protein
MDQDGLMCEGEGDGEENGMRLKKKIVTVTVQIGKVEIETK